MLMSTIHVSPANATHPLSARRYLRGATSASAPWDEKGSTARKVNCLTAVCSVTPSRFWSGVNLPSLGISVQLNQNRRSSAESLVPSGCMSYWVAELRMMIGPVYSCTTPTPLRLLAGKRQRGRSPPSLSAHRCCLQTCFVTQLHMAEPGHSWKKVQRTVLLLLRFIISTQRSHVLKSTRVFLSVLCCHECLQTLTFSAETVGYYAHS